MPNKSRGLVLFACPLCCPPLLKRLDQARGCPNEWWCSSVYSLILPHLFRVGPRLFDVRFGARCLEQRSVPRRRRQVSHRLMRLEDGLEHDFVEALLLDLVGLTATVVGPLALPSCLVRPVDVAAPQRPRRPSWLTICSL